MFNLIPVNVVIFIYCMLKTFIESVDNFLLLIRVRLTQKCKIKKVEYKCYEVYQV